MALRLDIGSVRATITGMDTVFKAVARSKAIIEGGLVLKREAEANIGLRDHSLTDLAQMDHPYARRHGRIRVHEERPWLVHSQSGALRRSLKRKTTRLVHASKFEVFFDTTKAPHAEFVVMGTFKMLPRDVLWETANDTRVRQLIMLAIVRTLGKDMRSKAGLRFGFDTGTP